MFLREKVARGFFPWQVIAQLGTLRFRLKPSDRFGSLYAILYRTTVASDKGSLDIRRMSTVAGTPNSNTNEAR